mmetsp:Transcript_17068/g.41893  ORF Transcript_17068/g.41893 Transcript_17068/m.41893 type:complete len:266 (-) Transcript_17068:422-1219(-)
MSMCYVKSIATCVSASFGGREKEIQCFRSYVVAKRSNMLEMHCILSFLHVTLSCLRPQSADLLNLHSFVGADLFCTSADAHRHFPHPHHRSPNAHAASAMMISFEYSRDGFFLGCPREAINQIVPTFINHVVFIALPRSTEKLVLGSWEKITGVRRHEVHFFDEIIREVIVVSAVHDNDITENHKVHSIEGGAMLSYEVQSRSLTSPFNPIRRGHDDAKEFIDLLEIGHPRILRINCYRFSQSALLLLWGLLERAAGVRIPKIRV